MTEFKVGDYIIEKDTYINYKRHDFNWGIITKVTEKLITWERLGLDDFFRGDIDPELKVSAEHLRIPLPKDDWRVIKYLSLKEGK